MDFLILGPLSPETGEHFFLGGGGGGGRGGSKVCAQKASSSGENNNCQNKQRSNGNAADREHADRRFDSPPAHIGGINLGSLTCRRHRNSVTGIQAADVQVCGRLHYHSTIACSESSRSPHCLKLSLRLKKTQTVCFCLLACLPDSTNHNQVCYTRGTNWQISSTLMVSLQRAFGSLLLWGGVRGHTAQGFPICTIGLTVFLSLVYVVGPQRCVLFLAQASHLASSDSWWEQVC